MVKISQRTLKKALALSCILCSLSPHLSLAYAQAKKPPVVKKAVAPKTGTLKIKVGVVMSSGDIKYIAKSPFYLLNSSLSYLGVQKSESITLPIADYLKSLGASDALIQWMNESFDHQKIVEAGITQSNFEQVKSVTQVPEFQKIGTDMENYRISCQQGYRYPSIRCDPKYFHVEDFVPPYLGQKSYWRYSAEQDFIAHAQVRNNIKQNVVTGCQTSFTGECTFSNLRPGIYYITPIEPIQIGSSRAMWDYKIQISPGTQSLELSNDNMTKAMNFATSWAELTEH